MDKSFEILLKEHRHMMLTYASALLGGDRREAEDVVQEASLVAFKRLDSFDVNASFPAWLRGIVRFKVFESRRALARSPIMKDPDVIQGMEDVFQAFDQPYADEEWLERITILQECILKLKDPMQRVVNLFYKSGKSLKEISAKMSINIMTAGQRLSRARKLIQSCAERQVRIRLQ